MPKTSKDVFEYLRQFFEDKSQSENERRNVWLVLTALHGPDSWDCNLKEATSAVIRHALLPGVVPVVLPGDDPSFLVMVNPDSPSLKAYRASLDGNEHFVKHAQAAFEILNLEW